MNKKLNYDKFWDNLSKLSKFEFENNINHLNSLNRSSTIFPVYFNNNTKTKISFLSYWLKKHGNNVVILLTARNMLWKTLVTN